MSWHNYTVDGYGICISDIEKEMKKKEFSEEKKLLNVKELLDMAPDLTENIVECFGEDYTYDDLMEYEHPDNCMTGLGAILHLALMEIYNDISFTLCDDFDGNQYIVFEPYYPWSVVSEREKSLNTEALDKIYKRYTDLLCDKEIGGNYQSVENGG